MQSGATDGSRNRAAERNRECDELERLANDTSQKVSLDENTLSGLYQRTYSAPDCASCAHLQADNRVLLLATYKRQVEILDLLGGENNDSCCCFVIKFG
jgi:hypothetical protein